MRHETQPWDRVRATLEIVNAGTGVTGKTPTVAIRRISDANWLQNGGGSWGAGFATNNMVEVDATNLPGLYQYVIPGGQLDHDSGLDGYVFRILEGTVPVLETVLVHTLRRSAWDDPRSGHVTAGTFGEGTLLATDAVTAAAIATSGKEEIADQVWDELITDHLTVGSTGKAVADLPSSTAIADQVWVEQIGDHSGVVGSTAEALAGISAAAIADQVWDEAAGDHTTASTMGKLLNDAGGAASPSTIADAVWDEATSGHTGAGSFGRAFLVTQGMVQANHRLKNPTYDPDGRMLTAQLVVYPTGTDATNDTNAIATFDVTCTYDGDGNLASLLSKEQAVARRRSSYIPLGVVTRGIGSVDPSGGGGRCTRGLIHDYPEGVEPTLELTPAPLLSTLAFDSNGTQRLLSDDIVSLHFQHVRQELFSNPDREYTGYAANGFWHTNGRIDPTHVPFKASWAVEGEGSGTQNRGTLDRFPARVVVAATFKEVAIFDADTLDLWMRFVIGTSPPPGEGSLAGVPSTKIRDVRCVNGFLVIATNEGLRVADFRTDVGYKLGQASAHGSGTLGLVARNSDTFLDEQSTVTPSLLLVNSDCLSMDAGAFSTSSVLPSPTVKGTRTAVACGHPDGITAVRLDDPGSAFPVTVKHQALLSVGNGWEVEDDGDFDDTSVFFVDDNFDATNWDGLGVQRGDALLLDTVSDRVITKVENIQPGRRLSVSPELNLLDAGASYEIARPVAAILISPELHLYFANGAGSLAVVRDQTWAIFPGTIFTALNVAGNNVAELTAQPDNINALAKRGDLLLAATSLGIFVATDDDLDERRRAEFRYSTPAVTEVDATFKILEGSDANCEAVSVDPETGNIQVAVTGLGSVVSEVNPNIEQTFRFFDDVGRIKALVAFRNPSGPPDSEVT